MALFDSRLSRVAVAACGRWQVAFGLASSVEGLVCRHSAEATEVEESHTACAGRCH